MSRWLSQGRQEDAEEYLGFTLNGLHEEMLALKKLISPQEESKHLSPHRHQHHIARRTRSLQIFFSLIHFCTSSLFSVWVKDELHHFLHDQTATRQICIYWCRKKESCWLLTVNFDFNSIYMKCAHNKSNSISSFSEQFAKTGIWKYCSFKQFLFE